MSIQSVLLPVLVEVALIFVLLGVMAKLRNDAMRAGLDPAKVTLSGDVFPPHARQIANCYANQFEMPILFLVVVLFGIVLHQTGWLFVLLEWVFVGCRLGHAFVHTTSNRVSIRGPLFLGSAAATGLLWLLLFPRHLFRFRALTPTALTLGIDAGTFAGSNGRRALHHMLSRVSTMRREPDD